MRPPGDRGRRHLRCRRQGRDGGRHRHPFPHRRQQREHGAAADAGAARCRSGRAASDAAGERGLGHLRDRLPLRRHGLHHRGRAGGGAGLCPARASRAGRHSDHRQGDPVGPGQRRLPAEPHARERERIRGARLRGLDARDLARARHQGDQRRRRGGLQANVREFSLDDVVPFYGVSSRAIVKTLQRAVHELGVPHPLHVHCNNLGLAGNADTALATIAAAEGLPLHLAHLQFYGYGKEGGRGFSSAAARLAEAVNAAKSVTVDVGQVMFGQTVTISSDVLRQFNAATARARRMADFRRRRQWRRHRAVQRTARRFLQRRAVVRRARAVPADRRSLARLLHHRSSQRRALHDLSGHLRAAHGPRSARAMDRGIAARRRWR